MIHLSLHSKINTYIINKFTGFWHEMNFYLRYVLTFEPKNTTIKSCMLNSIESEEKFAMK